jgi:hypothetical protein
MQMMVFEQLKMTGLLCSRYSATVQKGRRFFALAGKDMELPNGRGGKKKTASKRQQAVSPVAPAPEGGSPVEGEMTGELLAVPGPSGMCARSGESRPPVPVEESAAAATPPAIELTVVEPMATELPPAVPVVESEDVQPGVSAAELPEVGLPEPAVQATAAAPAAETVTVVRLVSEALSALDLTLGVGALTSVPAAVEPAAGRVAASATEQAVIERKRPVLVSEPAAAPKDYWVLNAAVGPKMILKKVMSGPAATAAEAAAASAEWAGEPAPELEMTPAARQAARETKDSPVVTASGPRLPMAAAAPVKRKAKAGVTGGSQKRKKSSPAEVKDL